ncbi:MAG: hypothetical protein BWY54_00358 [Candidatus Dependentiae bacterium ADurb.Bin331]|nr:MAG: hypothetical protein BWY54_00358 [Candidatus Dependentiae bacterium ADurb.Bin331]
MLMIRVLLFLALFNASIFAESLSGKKEYVCFVLLNDTINNLDVFTMIDHTQLFKSGGVYIGREQCITDCTLWQMFYTLHEFDLSAGLLNWSTKLDDRQQIQMRIERVPNDYPEIAFLVCDNSLQIKETLCIPLELIAQFFVHATIAAHIKAEEQHKNQKEFHTAVLSEIPSDEFDEFDEFPDDQLPTKKKQPSCTQYAQQLWAIALLQYYSLSDYCYETYKQLKDYIWPTKKVARVTRR